MLRRPGRAVVVPPPTRDASEAPTDALASKLFGAMKLEPPPPIAPVEGRFRNADGTWAPGLPETPVQTAHGDPVRALYGPNTLHCNPKIGVAPAKNSRGQPVGLGLYAIETLAPGELVCMFTGEYCLERDADSVFYGIDRACVDSYAAGHVRYALVDSEIAPGGPTTEPNPPLTPSENLPEVRCDGALVHELLCLPRMSSELTSADEEAKRLCALQYAPYAPTIADVAALINAPKYGGKRGPAGEVFPDPNVVAEACVGKPINAAFVGRTHACIAIFVGSQPIAPGEEILWDYAYRRGGGALFQAKQWNASKHSQPEDDWNRWVSLGERVSFEMEKWGRRLQVDQCGPPMWRVGCPSTRGKVWNALCVSGEIAYTQYVATLSHRVLRSDDNPRYRAAKAWAEGRTDEARRIAEEEVARREAARQLESVVGGPSGA